jgi:glycopeptide antibiotics resistance protein
MNTAVERFFHEHPVPARVVFKGVFGIGMLTLIFVGALFYLLGKDYTPTLQIVAATCGAIVGALSAGLVSRLSSRH